MCGIAGLWQQEGIVSVAELERMNAVLKHRGPDDAGIWCEGAVGLAHRRLAILDVSLAGHQPMVSPDGRWHLVFNGEIFNYQELAQRYLADITFTSTSDTEVLLHLLARYGDEAVAWLRGMYAFALWDSRQKELLLARDPFGKKPLYFSVTDGTLRFASEIKAILAGHGKNGELDPLAVTAYCSYEYVPAPATPWRDIEQVPLGSWQRWSSPTAKISKRFWQPHFVPKWTATETNLQQELDRVLRHSVQRRLLADVPVGLLLSGGLDSTTIGWYMRECGAKDFHSFSVSFEETSFDESRYAEMAAATLGTRHHSLMFTLEEFQNAMRELVPLMDSPLADASLLPTYVVSKLAREHVTVVLDGDGSDELFGGYGTFQAAEVAERLRWLTPVLPLVQALVSRLPTHYTDFSWDFKLKSFVRGLGLPVVERNQVWLASFTKAELSQLLTPAWYRGDGIERELHRLEDEKQRLSVLDTVSLATMYQYLHNDILVKLDRATMATSLEARTPFLDSDVADFALRLPDKYKRNKYLLKKLMANRLPADIVWRPKKGFGIPLGSWLQGPLYEWGREVLAAEKLREDGIFVPEAVAQLWREHRSGKADHRKKLWTLLTFQLWYDQWVANRPMLADISRPLAGPRLK